MKKHLLNFNKVLVIFFLSLITITNSQAQIDFNQLSDITSQLQDIQSYADSIQNLLDNTLSDSTLISEDSLNSLESQLSDLTTLQDSLTTFLNDNNISSDSIALIQNLVDSLAIQQDSLTKLLSDLNIVNMDSLQNVQDYLTLLQDQQDSLTTLLNDYNNWNKINVDSISNQLIDIQNNLNLLLSTQADSTYWNDATFLTYNGETSANFMWSGKGENDIFELQVSIYENFDQENIIIDNIKSTFYSMDYHILSSLLLDSNYTYYQQNARATSSSQTLYWRVGIKNMDTTIYSPIQSYDATKLMGIENITVQVSVAPNPTSGIVTINGVENIETVSIVNLSGQVVKTFSNQEVYNVSDLENGIYVLQVKTSKGTGIQKLQILK